MGKCRQGAGGNDEAGDGCRLEGGAPGASHLAGRDAGGPLVGGPAGGPGWIQWRRIEEDDASEYLDRVIEKLEDGEAVQDFLERWEMPFRVLVVDDEEEWRLDVAEQLKADFGGKAFVQAVGTVEAALQMVARSQYEFDVILLDVVFGEGKTNGVEAAQKIWEMRPGAAIIIMSSQTSEHFVRKLNRVVPAGGAHGWLVKSNLGRHLKRAVKQVLAGDCWRDQDVEVMAAREVELAGMELDRASYEVLLCAAVGLDNYAAAAKLNVTTKAVEKRLQKLGQILGKARERTAGIARGSGLMPAGRRRSQGSASFEGQFTNERCGHVAEALLLGYITVAEMRAFAEGIAKDRRLLMEARRIKMRRRIEESGRSAAKVLLKILKVGETRVDAGALAEFCARQTEQWQVSMCLLLEDVLAGLDLEFAERVVVDVILDPGFKVGVVVEMRGDASSLSSVGLLRKEMQVNQLVVDARACVDVECFGNAVQVVARALL